MFDVGEGLGRSKNDGVAGVNPDRVKVLHGADHHGVVSAIAHHLVLNLLEPSDRLLDQALGDRGQL